MDAAIGSFSHLLDSFCQELLLPVICAGGIRISVYIRKHYLQAYLPSTARRCRGSVQRSEVHGVVNSSLISEAMAMRCPISRVTGHVVLIGIHLSGYGVTQALGVTVSNV